MKTRKRILWIFVLALVAGGIIVGLYYVTDWYLAYREDKLAQERIANPAYSINSEIILNEFSIVVNSVKTRDEEIVYSKNMTRLDALDKIRPIGKMLLVETTIKNISTTRATLRLSSSFKLIDQDNAEYILSPSTAIYNDLSNTDSTFLHRSGPSVTLDPKFSYSVTLLFDVPKIESSQYRLD